MVSHNSSDIFSCSSHFIPHFLCHMCAQATRFVDAPPHVFLIWRSRGGQQVWRKAREVGSNRNEQETKERERRSRTEWKDSRRKRRERNEKRRKMEKLCLANSFPRLFPWVSTASVISPLSAFKVCECSALSFSAPQEHRLSARLHWHKY